MTALRLALAAALLTCAAPVLAQAPAPVPPETADAMFARPYIDKDEWRGAPVRHRYVHGGFDGTETRFSYYLPEKAAYEGRFFQYITPVPDSENLSQNGQTGEEDKIAFAIASGAIFVETNGGGAGNTGGPAFGADPTIGAWRANAAAARFVRKVAADMYGAHRTWGYAFGGSGGAFRTIGSIENTRGVWDGVVPYVVGSPMAAPNVFAVRMHAMRILKDRFDQIVDAVEPGGSGDPYAGLNPEEADALREVTRMGFPTPAWFGHRTMGVHGFTALYQGMVLADPTYFTDFWTKPGYLGANPPESLVKARLQFPTRVSVVLDGAAAQAAGIAIGRNVGTARGTADLAWQAVGGTGSGRPVAIRLEGTAPEVGFIGGDLVINSGAAAGKRIALRELTGNTALIGVADLRVLAALRPGDEVTVDNSNFLAAQTYHRHQVPPGREYPVWDQFRKADGTPAYPQRAIAMGPMFARGASGTLQSGRFDGKMIVLSSLWDREAFAWQADWYAGKVREHLGARTDDHFRLWYTDRALHGDATRQEDPARTVSYLGVLQQALRDLGAWAEKGVAPPPSTAYRVTDGQVIVPATASERRGIQPVVTLKVGSGKRIEVRPGQRFRLSGTIEVPPGAGTVVAAEWDFDGKGAYPFAATVRPGQRKVRVSATWRFDQPGTYFPVLRGIAQRQGDTKTAFARIQNLDRVRVVVKAR